MYYIYNKGGETMLKQKNMILRLVAIACAVLAFVFMFLPGLSAKEKVMGETVSASIALFSLVFGGGTMASKMGSISTNVKFKGGMSIFALLAFLCLVAAIVVLVLSLVKKEKTNLVLIGAGLLVLAGIFVLLVKVAGTNITSLAGEALSKKVTFKNFIDGLNLGIGSILFAVFAILGGASAATSNFIK